MWLRKVLVVLFVLGSPSLAALAAGAGGADSFNLKSRAHESSSGIEDAIAGAMGGGGHSRQRGLTASPVAVLLQLTDIHLSAMNAPSGDPKRLSDLLSLSTGLLARWPLAAALLTGDLTEAKDVYGRGRQDEQEWKMYQGAWNALASIGHVPYSQIYDIRGNHDTFNSGTRCGSQDYFCSYSAHAARLDRTNRNGTEVDTVQRGPRERILIDAVYGETDGRRGGSGDADGAGSTNSGCPVAVVVGVDASLDPGMRSPTNFLGVVLPAVLDELDEQLAASLASMRAAGCNPPYIAYGHYPLSTIAYPGRQRRRHTDDDGGRGGSIATAAATSVQEVLVRHGVSAYLAGHLHGAFGRKLHRLHKTSAAGTFAAAAADVDDRPVGHMLELEMVDWKYARTVRLITLDQGGGGAISFEDFRYLPPPQSLPSAVTLPSTPAPDNDEVEHRLEPFDRTFTVGDYLPLITCPPDARYSPQLTISPYTHTTTGCSSQIHNTSSSGEVTTTALIRVMLLPVSPAVPAVPKATVYLHWACEVNHGGGRGVRGGRSDVVHPGLNPGQHRQQDEGTLSSTAGPKYGIEVRSLSRGHQGSSTGSNSGRGAAKGLSGVVQMKLEFANAIFSTFTADLLSSGGGAADEDSKRLETGSVSDILGCPPGLIVIQARVDDAGKDRNSSDGVGGGGGGGSTSEERPLHWRPPPPPPSPPESDALPSISRHHRQAKSLPSMRDVFWTAMDGAVVGGGGAATGGSSSSSVQVSPAPLQQTTLEWIIMYIPWHRFGLFAFAVQWCILALAMLAAPRVLVLLKARRGYNLAQQWQRPGGGGGGRQRQWRGNGRHGDPHESDDEGETDNMQELAASVAIEAGGSGTSVDRRQKDWIGEGASTSVRLGGSNCKSTALKRNNSSSSSGGGLGVGVRETHGGGGDTLPSAMTMAPTSVSPCSHHHGLPASSVGEGVRNHGDEATPALDVGDGRRYALRLWLTAWGMARCWLLWPLRDLSELAGYRDFVPWLTLFMCTIYLAIGPWMAGKFITQSQDGDSSPPLLSGYGILAAYGIYMRPLMPDEAANPQQPGWIVAPSQDHVVIVNVIVLTCVAPGLLLCASSAARLRRIAGAGKLCNGRGAVSILQILSWRQAVALCGIAVLNLGLCWKLWAGLGCLPVLLSPGLGWWMPLLVAWLWMTSLRVAHSEQQPDRQADL